MSSEHNSFPSALSLGVHELRTPLSVGLGYLRMLIREQAGPISDKQKKMLEEVERSCVRMAALVDEMSDLRKLLSGEMALSRQSFDLAALVEELAGDMHEGGDRGVELVVRGVDRPLRVVGDRVRIAAAIRVLLLLVVRERASGVVVAECSRMNGVQPAALVVVGDEERLPELADAAGRGTLVGEWKGGTGFGLPVARRVIEAHGGTITSAPGDEADRPRAGLALRIPLEAD